MSPNHIAKAIVSTYEALTVTFFGMLLLLTSCSTTTTESTSINMKWVIDYTITDKTECILESPLHIWDDDGEYCEYFTTESND